MYKAFLISFTFVGLALGDLPDFNAPHHPSQILVRFQPGTSYQSKQSLHELLGTGPVLREYAILSDLQLVQVPDGAVQDSVMAYLDDSNVLYAEPDYERELESVCNPNDTLFVAHNLLGLEKVRAPEAWCVETGDSNFLVAVIDGGIKFLGPDHPDLKPNIWVNPVECPGGMGTCVANETDDDNNGKFDDFYGWDFYDESNDVTDPPNDSWHGTHVAGIIGAVGNNGQGVVGVNWQVKLVALRIFPVGLGSGTFVSRVLAALDYCVANNIKVSNNSYGGNGLSQSECGAIQAAGTAIGHIFVAAAGNGGQDLDANPLYPASCGHAQQNCAVCPIDNIITVAATDFSDRLACLRGNTCPPREFCPPNCGQYSNYGHDTVHIAAPGVGILSTVYVPTNLPPPNPEYTPSYEQKTGTSMSAPYVAGAVALVWAAHPTWDYYQVRDHVLHSAHKGLVTEPNGYDFIVNGQRLDIGAAFVDCNNNGVADGIDVYNHTSDDCNGNNIPDECDAPGAFGACCLPSGCADHYKDYTCDAAGGDFLGIHTMCGCWPGCGIFRQ